jgi:FtsP/CotA-like multicopper oxidase with cupredoxin domain
MMAPMSRDDRSFLGLGAFGVAIAALCVALFGLRDSGTSTASSSAGATPSGGGADTSQTVDITLSDFKITPQMPSVKPGPVTFKVTNTGTQAHNLSIPSLAVKTPDIQPGTTVTLKVSTVPTGSFDMLCEVAGHAAAGMTGQLHVDAESTGSGSGSSAAAPPTTMNWQTMDKMMLDVAQKFPAATKGHGGDLLPPKILADGTKEFDVTAEVVDWEVSPGKIVKAWTYNGVVPAPEIHVEVGDKVKVVLTNNLPESTDIHFHGIRVPNAMDGVDPYTQMPVTPGSTFTYEFTALEPAVGIYHSHHDAETQIPNGLFGVFSIGEMKIPQFMKDKGFGDPVKKINMVLNDSGTIGLSLNGKSFPATEPYTVKVGDVVEVNYLNEGLLGHPMHMHQPVGWIIAKDGNPLEQPLPADTIWIAPGERYTVLYKATDVGVWAWHCHILTHAESATGMFGMVTALIVEK